MMRNTQQRMCLDRRGTHLTISGQASSTRLLVSRRWRIAVTICCTRMQLMSSRRRITARWPSMSMAVIWIWTRFVATRCNQAVFSQGTWPGGTIMWRLALEEWLTIAVFSRARWTIIEAWFPPGLHIRSLRSHRWRSANNCLESTPHWQKLIKTRSGSQY